MNVRRDTVTRETQVAPRTSGRGRDEGGSDQRREWEGQRRDGGKEGRLGARDYNLAKS